MTYALVKNGDIIAYPTSIQQFRDANRSISLPSTPTKEQLEEVGLFEVQIETAPEIDYTKVARQTEPSLVNGVVRVGWIVEDASEEVINRRYKERAQEVRDKRTKLLSSSDWTQVEDAPVDRGAWQGYRQLLRDIPSQEQFPWNVVWPQEPTLRQEAGN